jgi:hypothetical protein
MTRTIMVDGSERASTGRLAALKEAIAAQREAAGLKRKLEQGSQQTQGEALELGLETLLAHAFPMDEIQPVPKGVNGADLLQRVRSPSGSTSHDPINTISEGQAGWIQTLKDDQQTIGAEIAVLVTSAMPKEAREPFVREADVWVNRLHEAMRRRRSLSPEKSSRPAPPCANAPYRSSRMSRIR